MSLAVGVDQCHGAQCAGLGADGADGAAVLVEQRLQDMRIFDELIIVTHGEGLRISERILEACS